jgi:hypothetical protein
MRLGLIPEAVCRACILSPSSITIDSESN